MWKHKHGSCGIHCSLLLLIGILILVMLVGNTDGSPYMSYSVSNLNVLSEADTSTNTYNPGGYVLLNSTSQISGSVSDLISNDGVNMSFNSYSSGPNGEDCVDNNTSNVDSSPDKGTHSNFSALLHGPDSIYDTLAEERTSVVGGDWGITSSTFTGTANHASYRYMGGTSPGIDNMKVTKLHIRYSGTGTVAIALYTGGTLADPTGATKRTEAFNVAVSSGWNEIDVPDYDWEKDTVTWIGWCHGGGNVYYSTSSGDAGDFQSARGRWNQDIPFDADETSAMPGSPGSGSFFNSWYAVYVEYETGNYEMDLEVEWSNVGYDESNEELAIYVDEANNTHSLDATGGYMVVGDGTPDWGSVTGTISFWVKMDSSVQGRFWGQNGDMETRWSGTNLLLDWGGADSMVSAYSFSADTWYFVAIVWDETNDDLLLYVGDESTPPQLDANSLSGSWNATTPSPTENRFLNGIGGFQPVDGHGDDLRYWDSARSLTEIQSDYNTELTGSEPNLRSYFKLNNSFDDIGPDNNDGSGSGSTSFSSDVPFDAPPTEDIRVDVWNGTIWQNLFTDLTSGWNNVSVSSYLDSSNFTIRFKGNIETSDTIQDSWDTDVVLLHTWTDQYIAEVEFAGSSNADNWQQLNWTIDSAWTIGSVNVTIQLFNYTLGNYPISGIGYIEYTSSSTPNTDETKYQLIMSNPQDFRNDTGGWKIKVKGVTNTDTEFDLNVDLIEFKPMYPSGSLQLFSWVTTLLYVLPLVFVLLFILILIRRRRKPRVSHIGEKPDGFSKSFGMTHQQMVGQKMLLEIDPTSDFHNVLSSFVAEAKKSDESLFILTNKTSTLHLAFADDPNVKFLLFTSKTSSSQRTSKNETLLPATDLSVLLDAFVRIQKAESKKTINVLFDNISDIILRCGFEKTYKFTRFLLEAISSPKTTALFLFNPTAHEGSVSSSIRGLFQIHLVYTKRGPSAKTSL